MRFLPGRMGRWAGVAAGAGARPVAAVRSIGSWSWKARLAAGAGVIVGAGALAIAGAWLFGRPGASVTLSDGALIHVDVGGIGTQVTSVEASVDGKPLALVHGAGGLVPKAQLTQNEAVKVTVSLRTPSWVSWLTGEHATRAITLYTPVASPSETVAFASNPGAVQVSFDHPVSVVEYSTPAGTPHLLRLDHPATTVDIPVSPQADAGSLEVSSAPLPWETLAAHQSSLTWFASSDHDGALAVGSPAPGSTTAAPDAPVSLTFSEPVSQVLGSTKPRITPDVAGAWSEPNANTILFTPSGFGFGPGADVTVTFDRPVSVVGGAATTVASASNTYSFNTTQGSVLRLEQILAGLHYLPLDFVPNPGVSLPNTFADEVATMSHPVPGHFEWKWSSTPASLEDQWTVGSDNEILQGALMAFDSNTQADYDGYQADDESISQLANGQTWEALLNALLHHEYDPNPYSYVYVSQSLPETLTLWENGSVVLTSPTNTGIPERPTAEGTYPIYVRYTFNYMSGFNPDGSYYHDPVYWINYFNGGDAVHGFPRASYGYPQSLGCVELPISTAEVAFDHLAIGDLVTVAG